MWQYRVFTSNLCWAQSSKFKNSKLIIDSVGFKKSTLNQLLELHFERGLGDGLHSKASSIALKGDILWDVDRQSLLYLCLDKVPSVLHLCYLYTREFTYK